MLTGHLRASASIWLGSIGRHMATSAGAPVRGRTVVAVTQMTCTADKEANRAQAVSLLEKAKARGAEVPIIVKYESFCY